MKIVQAAALSAAALTLAAGALLVTPASAKTMHHGRHMRHHMMTRRHTMMHHSAMTKGTMNMGTMKGSAAAPTSGMANPAMSTAPATSGGDKP